ncbi:MAG: threonine/serine exporter family protein [Deltaproteobacteria bacterium]|nr:MAG: threonine/serine exporter family protein [Deltaproteobacteria bacterium]
MNVSEPSPHALTDAEVLLCDLALGLHHAGAPAHRLEEVVGVLAPRLGVEARVFSTPTAIYAGFGSPRVARTVLLRTGPGALDLGRLDAVDDLVKQLVGGQLDLDRARHRLEQITAAGARYPLWATLPAYAAASGAIAVLFGGGLPEVLAATGTGLGVGAVIERASQRPGVSTLADLLGAALAGALAGAVSRIVWPVDVGLVSLAGIIALVPGLSLTTAMMELGSRHLSSGTARLGGVLSVFASLALGSVGGMSLWLWWPAPVHASSPLPPWSLLVALAVAIVSFTVLLKAPLRDLHVIATASLAGYFTAILAGQVMPPPFDAAAGALAVSLVAHGAARLRDRPAALALVPGLFLLVPGSVGFRGLVSLLSSDVDGGLDTAIQAGITAMGLAAGVIVANVILPPRRPL